MLNNENLKKFALISCKVRDSIHTTFIPHNIRSPSQSNYLRKRNKRLSTWKGRNKINTICR